MVGLAEWKGREMPETEALRDFVANPERFVESKAISAQSPREALAELLALVAAPMPIEAACRVAPQLWGLPDAPAASEIPEVADAAAGAQEAAHWNECLRWAWREIGAMPPKHRAALLLNSDLPLELVAAGIASSTNSTDHQRASRVNRCCGRCRTAWCQRR